MSISLEKIIGQIAEAIPQSYVNDSLILFPPIDSLIRGLCFDRTSPSSEFRVWMFVMVTCCPTDTIYFAIAKTVKKKDKSELWSTTDKKLVSRLSKRINKKALPFLDRFESLEDVAKVKVKKGDLHTLESKAYALARIGEYKSAKKAISSLIEKIDDCDKEDDLDSTDEPMYKNAQILKDTLSKPAVSKRSLTQKLLRGWEVETLKNLKLDKLKSHPATKSPEN